MAAAWSSLAVSSITTPNQSSRSAIVDHVVLHHMASTSGAGALELMRTGNKQVSANYVCLADGSLVGVVPEGSRSWSLSDAGWDSRSITVETENESGAPAWTVSAKSHEALAQLCADVSRRYGFPINRDTVLGHREVYSRYGRSYPTACPGAMNLDWIVDRANQILSGVTAPSTKEIEMAKLYRLKGTAPVYLVNVDTGLFWWVPDEAQLAVVVAHFAESGTITDLDQNGWDRLTAIIGSMRPSAKVVDVPSIIAGVIAGLKIPTGSDPVAQATLVADLLAKRLSS